MKMKNLIRTILGIMGLVAPMAVDAGQTVVQVRIATDTVWEASQGPYIIQGKVVIENGATLTLRPGTKVYFAAMPKDGMGGSGLIIQGGLEAQGLASESVCFLPLVPGESWGQLYFQQSDSDHSFLQHCVIKGGRVVCNASSPSIEQCSLSGSNNAIVVGPGSHPRIIGNRIAGNTIGLTFLDEVVGSVVSGNSIFDNEYGVCAENFGKSRMAENQIFGNRLSDCLDPLAQRPMVSSNPSDSRTLEVASTK
jgi:hypothetical protein